MSIDELYSKERDMQQALPGMGGRGEDTVAYAIEWVERHPLEWTHMKKKAKVMAADGRRVSVKFLIEMVRSWYMVPIRNAAAPAFARMLVSECPELAPHIHMSASQCDPFMHLQDGEDE